MSDCCVAAHPHNLPLNAPVEFGSVGVALLLLLAMIAVARLGGLQRLAIATSASRDTKVLSAMLLAFLALSMVSGSAYWLFPMVNLAVLSALWLASLARPLGGERSQSSPSENAASRSCLE